MLSRVLLVLSLSVAATLVAGDAAAQSFGRKKPKSSWSSTTTFGSRNNSYSYTYKPSKNSSYTYRYDSKAGSSFSSTFKFDSGSSYRFTTGPRNDYRSSYNSRMFPGSSQTTTIRRWGSESEISFTTPKYSFPNYSQPSYMKSGDVMFRAPKKREKAKDLFGDASRQD